jgi:hypothetical protein
VLGLHCRVCLEGFPAHQAQLPFSLTEQFMRKPSCSFLPPAAAARSALAAEQERAAALETELESLRAQLAHAASSACETSEDEASIRAYRPAATRQPPAAGPPGSMQTPRSRLSLPAAPGRGTPAAAGGAGVRGLTPRSATSAGGVTPRNSSGWWDGNRCSSAVDYKRLQSRCNCEACCAARGSPGSSARPPALAVGQRPQQVSRLNLGSGVRAPGSEGRQLPAPGVAAGPRPPMSKLNLSKLSLVRSEAEENKTPLSARVSGGAAPGSAATTPRGGAINTPRGSTSWLTEGSESDRDSPSDAAGGPRPAEEAGQEVESFELAVSPPRPLTSRSAARHQAAAAPAAVARPAGQLPKMALPLGRIAQQRRVSTGVESRLTQARHAAAGRCWVLHRHVCDTSAKHPDRALSPHNCCRHPSAAASPCPPHPRESQHLSLPTAAAAA